MTTTQRTFRIEEIAASELTASDLRRAAATAWVWNDPHDLPGKLIENEIDVILDGMNTTEPFAQYPVLAYRIEIEGSGEKAEAVVDTVVHRIGIAWGADADWGDLRDACDLTTEEGGDRFADALHRAIDDWLNDREAWESRG